MLVELGVTEQRYRAVLAVLEEGLTVTEVARRNGVARLRYLEDVDAESFGYLWDGTEEGWVLVRGRGLPTIFNRVTRMALVVEDDDLWASVVQQMIERGAEVLEELPRRLPERASRQGRTPG